MTRKPRVRKSDPIRAFESSPIDTLKMIRGECARVLRVLPAPGSPDYETDAHKGDAVDAFQHIDALARFAIVHAQKATVTT